jgi:hypothetical protein
MVDLNHLHLDVADYAPTDIDARRKMRGKLVKGVFVIYRACSETERSFRPMDYVTKSAKFAIEHAAHMIAVEGEPYHVLKMIATDNVYEALNPGEYFYDGRAKTGKVYLSAQQIEAKFDEAGLHLDVAMANRAGSAVRLDDIPARYKKLKVLGRGTTTIALDDGDSVILITRDAMKKEWLQHNFKTMVLDTFEKSSRIYGMRELPIYVLRVPKLYKLNLENRRLATKALKEFTKLRASQNGPDADKAGAREQRFRELEQHFTADEEHVLAPLFSFLANYDVNQYYFDLSLRNFMQTADGKLVVSDPVVMSDIMDLIAEHHKRQYMQRQYPAYRF